MATRCIIALKISDNYQYCICANDGKLNYVGPILLKYYGDNSDHLIESLVSGGDMNGIRPHIYQIYYYFNSVAIKRETDNILKTSNELGIKNIFVFEDNEWTFFNKEYDEDELFENINLKEWADNNKDIYEKTLNMVNEKYIINLEKIDKLNVFNDNLVCLENCLEYFDKISVKKGYQCKFVQIEDEVFDADTSKTILGNLCEGEIILKKVLEKYEKLIKRLYNPF